jgi:hypothetical protein
MLNYLKVKLYDLCNFKKTQQKKVCVYEKKRERENESSNVKILLIGKSSW